jgi:hypothetical protein
VGQGPLIFGQCHGPTWFHEAMTGTGWVGTIEQIRGKVRIPNAPYGIFTCASQRGRSAEIRKTPRVIGADRHASLIWSDQVARVNGWDIESWSNAQASGTFTYFRHAARVLPHATEQLGHLGASQVAFTCNHRLAWHVAGETPVEETSRRRCRVSAALRQSPGIC